jgi:hypothetical protein
MYPSEKAFSGKGSSATVALLSKGNKVFEKGASII